MKSVIQEEFKSKKTALENAVLSFNKNGKLYGKGDRNIIKLFEIDGLIINIKSFKKPNLINTIAYKYFRKSKAQRSFEYACKLRALNIGTPPPIAYFENSSLFGLKDSYYISTHLDYDLTLRNLNEDVNHPDFTKILKGFTRYTFNLHQNNICFLDHSPGNTLIKKKDKGYSFYLVDLNRMRFGSMSFKKRIKNFSKLTIHKSIVKIMSKEYAKCTGEDYNEIYNYMWETTEAFQRKYYRKIRLKKTLRFWKK